MSARRLALTIEYDGTGLSGWQRQDNGPTIQEHIETALSTLLATPTQVVGASRTDAGVHAEGQVCHLDLDHPIPALGLARGLNSLLPPSIAVREAREVASDFHARFSARGKRYVYRVLNRATRSPLEQRRSWHVRAPLDVGAMQQAALGLIGERDFSAFRATGCSARTATRRITAVTVEAQPGQIIEITVVGNAFLRNMVRIIAGTLVAVGRAQIAGQDIETIIDSKDRTRAGQTAPAAGLTLAHIFYEPIM